MIFHIRDIFWRSILCYLNHGFIKPLCTESERLPPRTYDCSPPYVNIKRTLLFLMDPIFRPHDGPLLSTKPIILFTGE